MTAARGEGVPSGWIVAAIALAALGLAYVLRLVLLPLAFALALAYVLRPLVTFLQRSLRLSRLAAVLIVYLTVVAAVVVIVWWVVASFGPDLLNAAGDAPTALARPIQRLFGPEVHAFGQTFSPDDIARRVVNELQAWAEQPVALVTAGTLVVAGPAALVLTLVLLFYFIHSGRELAEGVLWLAPPPYRPMLRRHGRRIHPMLYRYVRGLFVIVLYTVAVASLVLGPMLHLPYAIPIAVAVGVFELVPVVGPAASLALMGGTAVLNGGGLWHFVGLMGFAVGLRLSIDEVVGPVVLGRAVTLHPAVIILTFLVAASLFGVLGVLFAVPVAAAVKIVLSDLYGETPGT